MSRIFSNVLETIGKTPVVRLNRIGATNATVYAKCEFFNPLHSVKDRLALAIVSAARESGALRPGQTLVEASSGNTGVGLAMVCAALGHPLVVVMSESFSVERRKTMRMLGARVVLTPAAARGTGMTRKASELAALNGWFLADQFKTPANAAYHSQTTASEILLDFAGKPLDWFVTGFGTGGTLVGVGRMLRVARPAVRVALAEPEQAPLVASGLPQPRDAHGDPSAGHGAFKAPHPVQGWTPDFVPLIVEQGAPQVRPDMFVTVGGPEAMAMSQRLAREEGLFTGVSGGASVASAVKVAERCAAAGEKRHLHILTVLPDTAERYTSGALFESISADMNAEETKLSLSTPSFQLTPAAKQ